MSYIKVAQIETALMVEFLASPGERPELEDATWVCNAERGPNPKGIRKLQYIQKRFGTVNVTTGNAYPLDAKQVGIYVRSDVYAVSPNFLREHLS